MLCDNCQQRPATVHQTLILNGAKQENHLCETCAQTKGQLHNAIPGGYSFPNLSIQQLLSGFLGLGPQGGTPSAPRQQGEPRCKHCGMTYSDFAGGGLLGCSHCYDQLEPYLVPLIKRIHGTTGHGGKAPKRTGGLVRKRRELEALKQQLSAEVSQERFEEAARLRDQIKAMEAELKAGGDSRAVE